MDNIATVGDLIEYIEANFKPDEKLCYIDCIQGVKYEAVPLAIEDLGNAMFKYDENGNVLVI